MRHIRKAVAALVLLAFTNSVLGIGVTYTYDTYGNKCFSATYDAWGRRTVATGGTSLMATSIVTAAGGAVMGGVNDIISQKKWRLCCKSNHTSINI